MNPNLFDYRILTFEDLPELFHSQIVEHGGGTDPDGADGVSESGTTRCLPPSPTPSRMRPACESGISRWHQSASGARSRLLST